MVDDYCSLDESDRKLLGYLQPDARLSNAELARRLGLSGTGLQKRLKKLENAGIVQQYVTLLNREALGYDMLCFIQLTLQRAEIGAIERFKQQVQTMPEVLDCHFVTGDYDYLLKVIVRNRAHLESFLIEKLTPLPGMDKIRTNLVLTEIKATTVIPLES